jgi:phage head maturation protease
MKRGDVSQLSFMYFSPQEHIAWEQPADALPVRRVLKVTELLDVTVATFPAFPQTTVEARAKVKELQQGQVPQGADGGQVAAKYHLKLDLLERE